jgi:hypothetical protein
MKVSTVLNPDPITGVPPMRARGPMSEIDRCPTGQTRPSPRAIDFTADGGADAGTGAHPAEQQR